VADWLVTTPVAHRGLHEVRAGIPENSLAAFRRAAAHDYAAEFDVRLLGDGNVVVMHDRTFARMTGVDLDVQDADVGCIDALRLRGTNERVPLLDDVLTLIGGSVPLLIEVKNETGVGALETAVAERLGAYRGPVAVQTFHPGSLAELARLLPAVPCGFLFGPNSTSADVPSGRAWLDAVRGVLEDEHVHFAGCDIRPLPYEPVTGLRNRIPVLGWTVRSAEDERRVRRWCDNVIFEGFLPAAMGKNGASS